jgi:DNA-directed RNA polymerase specialized sigma24 family protein
VSEDAELTKLLRGVLALLAADRDDRVAGEKARPRRSELVLAEAGLSVGEVAALLGRNRETVKSAVRRARRQPHVSDD